MSNDLERAVLCQFDPSPDAARRKAEAAVYCAQLRASPKWWELLVEHYNATSYIEVKFWCLNALQEMIPKQYIALDPSAKETLRGAIVKWILDPRMAQQLPLLRNKLAQTVTSVIRLEFPKMWPMFFHDLIEALKRGVSVADMFCRILLAIDSDIISLDIHRTAHEQKVSVQLKDAMRDSCIHDIVDAWYNLVLKYHTSEPELTILVLQTLQKYISWMSIGLVVNNQFMPLLFELLKLSNESLQEASIDCLNEILLKGMEPPTKIHIVQKMDIVPCCSTWKDGLPGSEGNELREKCAKLLATLCSEILECWKRIENSCISMRACKIDIKSSVKNEAKQICGNCERMIDALFPAVMAVIHIREDETSMSVVPFLSAYILRLKHVQERTKRLSGKELEAVRDVLGGVLSAARFPDPSDVPPGPYASEAQRVTGVEEIESVHLKRRDLFTIFKNIVRIHHEMVISTLLEQLQITLQNAQAPFQDVEVLITAVFELGEVQSVALQETGCGPLAALVLPLIRAEVPNRHHQIVALAILDLYLRCYKVPLQHQGEFPRVLSTFIGTHGIRHPAEGVSDRACYLFMRFVKSCRSVMSPFAMHILQSLSDFFGKALTTPRPKSSAESMTLDQRFYVFEAAGLLLGIEDLESQQQKEALVTMLQPATLQLESALSESAEEWRLLQSLEMMTRMSKGFRHEYVTTVRPPLSQVFVQCMEVALRIPSCCKSVAIYSKVLSFLHRMVELLGELILPYLQPAFDVLLQAGQEAAHLCELVTLTHQLVSTFGQSLIPFLTVALPIMLRHIWMCLGADWDWTGRQRMASGEQSLTGEAVMVDEIREKEELQRLTYGFLYAIFANTDALLFLEMPDILHFMLSTIHQGACLHAEIAIRRICFQIYAQLVERWCDRMKKNEELNGYFLNRIGHEVCIQSAVQGSLDISDAATHSLFQDMANCSKSLFRVCGDPVLRRMCQSLEESGFPAEFGDELEQRLRAGDDKRLKDFYRILVKHAKQ